jgi:hypothetical protein
MNELVCADVQESSECWCCPTGEDSTVISIHTQMAPDRPDVDHAVPKNRERGLNLSSNEHRPNT